MSDSFIYVVGQPDLKSGTVKAIHRLGLQAGLLRDSRLSESYADIFDRVIDVDFADIVPELSRLESLRLKAAGFLCTYENYIIAKAKISHHFAAPSLSTKSALLCTDKALMREAFITTDPAISPQFSTVESSDEAKAFADIHGYPLIIKPTGLVKSLLVMQCNDADELRHNVTRALDSIEALYEKYRIYDRKPQLIIEECMVGDQFSIAAFIDGQGKPFFCDGAVKLTTAQDIGVNDNYLYKRELPAPISPELTAELIRVSAIGIQALGMRSSAAHIELMHTSSGVKIIEIGARIGGYRPRMYASSYDIDLTEQEVRLALGEQPRLSGKFIQPSAVYELFPSREGQFTAIKGQVDKLALQYYRETASKGDHIGPAKDGFKAAAILIVSHKNKSHFLELCHQVEQLYVGVSS